MSGHSKWATTKHRKGAKDSARAKVFAKLIRQVEVAAREGGGDPNTNASLRTMFQKAREASVPIDTIERAIKRGTGELEGVRYEAISYEGYAPGGVAIIIETLTDNRNRTSAEIKHLLSKNGGNIAEPGAVSWQFDRKGLIEVKGPLDEDQLLEWVLEAGGENFSRPGRQLRRHDRTPRSGHGARRSRGFRTQRRQRRPYAGAAESHSRRGRERGQEGSATDGRHR